MCNYEYMKYNIKIFRTVYNSNCSDENNLLKVFKLKLYILHPTFVHYNLYVDIPVTLPDSDVRFIIFI